MASNSQNRDVRGRFTKMTPDDLVPVNVSAEDVQPGTEVPRHAPASDTLAGEGPTYGSAPLGHRTARTVRSGDATTSYAGPRPETYLRDVHTGADGRPLPDELRYVLGSDGPVPGGLSTMTYGDETGRTMSPIRSEDIAPGRGRRAVRPVGDGAGRDRWR
jgi:hypothetical protein